MHKLLNRFISYLQELQHELEELVPLEIKQALDKLNQKQVVDGFYESKNTAKRARYLKQFITLNAFGFNSGEFKMFDFSD